MASGKDISDAQLNVADLRLLQAVQVMCGQALIPIKKVFLKIRCLMAGLFMPVVAVLFFMLIILPGAHAAMISKTPNDVFQRVEDLKQQVLALREEQKIADPWPAVGKQTKKEPRHVYQKSLEVLGKIARLRRIRDMGPITIPQYPSREITPNEVFDLVDRLVLEMATFNAEEPEQEQQKKKKSKTPSDVYEILWEVSKALDRVIGIRGLRPTDVYALSLQVVEMARFLRLTQNLPMHIEEPERTRGKHPNHALAATIILAEKISMAEKNLWMEPISVPTLPRRTVAPEEVYDSLLLVLAELRRIQFRIGVERYFPTQSVEGIKSPDDVIFNINTAISLMPVFSKAIPLIQGDQKALEKSPNDVYFVAEHILGELMEYRQHRGIRTIPRRVPPQANLKPRHVYTKTLECLEKTNLLRKQVGLGAMALPGHPLREITPSEVYQQTVRLDGELDVVFTHAGLESVLVQLDVPDRIYRDKTPSDVFSKMWEISYLLDTIVGLEGYKPTDVYLQAKRIVEEITILRRHLGETGKVEVPPRRKGVIPAGVIKKAGELSFLLHKIKRRSGIMERAIPMASPEGEVTPDDVFNEMGLILSELITLKVHFGITDEVSVVEKVVEEKVPSHVYQQVEYAYRLLSDMLAN